MSRIYGRKYDVYSASKELLDSNITSARLLGNITTYDDIVSSADYIEPYLSCRALEILENSNINFKRNIFGRESIIVPANEITKTSEIIFPTYRARENYKIDFVHFLGDILTGSKNRSQEFGLLLPFLFEYFYFLETSDSPQEDFEKRNLSKMVKLAKNFVKIYDQYDQNPDNYEILDFESLILRMMTHYSSFDASLTLIDMMKDNMDEVLSVIDSFAIGEDICDVLEDKGIETYGYKNLKKSIRNINIAGK